MKITIVTVCLNTENTIEDTIVSVLNQSYKNIEYIIMDGASTDGTMDIINRHVDNPCIKVLSQKDSGIYDAMNRSLDIATGDYVIFMNSGDMFYDSSVLADIVPFMHGDIVYGDVYRRENAGGYIQKYKGTSFERTRMLLCGLAMCHQSQFTKLDIMKKYRFNESHKITADYDFVGRAIKDKLSFEHIDRVICSFDNVYGVSAQKDNYLTMLREDDETIRDCFPFWYYVIKIPKGIYRRYKINRGKFN